MLRYRISVCLFALFALQSAGAPATRAEGRLFDDFSTQNSHWRLGNAELNRGSGTLILHGRQPEAVLTGTALHPENLRNFTATIRFRFGSTGDPVLIVAWAKPREWDPLPESRFHCFMRRDGRVTFKHGTQTVGQAQLAPPKSGLHTLKFAHADGKITVDSADGRRTISLPEEAADGAGYFSLRQQGIRRRSGDTPLCIESVELIHAGARAPMTAQQRHTEIQSWVQDRLNGNEQVLGQFAQHIDAETAAGRWGFATDMSVGPGLVAPGEPVTIELSSVGVSDLPAKVRIEPNFLSAAPGQTQTRDGQWQAAADGRQVARIELKPKQTGNWRVTWRAGEEQLVRTFAVVDRGYTVCRFLITNHPGLWKSGRDTEAYDVVHEYGLPTEYWAGTSWQSPFARSPEDLLDLFRVFSEMKHRYGDRVFAQCNANWIVPGCHDTNLWRLDERLQRQGIAQLHRLWALLGVGPMEILGGYTYGHETPRAARLEGVKILDSLVQWQNWRDGGDDNAWLINQWGAPTVPYYVADDDYRKVAPGKSIVAFTQATTSNVRMYYINFLEGQPQLSYLRRRPPEDMAETANIHRFNNAVDLWLAEAPHQEGPLFVSVGLENFRDSPDWNQANKLGVRYTIEQARHHKIVFVSAVDIADYYHRHYDRQPETWLYWPDLYAGYQAGYKPRRAPDRIEVSNARWHTVHEEGGALPRFFWDYTKPWSEPVWDDQSEIRLKYGLVKPELLTANNCVPKMVDTTGVEAKIDCHASADGVVIEITVASSRRLEWLPVAVWNIPLEPAGVSVAERSKDTRTILTVDGSTDNLSAVVVCPQLSAGENRFRVRLNGSPRQPLDPVVQLGPHVGGRVFNGEDGPAAYVWLANEESPEGTLRIRVSETPKAYAQDNAGRRILPENGLLEVPMRRDWQHESPRIVGLSAAQLRASANYVPAE